MDLPISGGLALLSLAFAVFCGWRGARPPDHTKGPRMVPWQFLMLLGAVAVIVFLVRVANDLHLLGN